MKTDITIRLDASIKEAMRLLDETSEKVLLIVNEDKTLLGSLTDGDIRRYILRTNNLKGIVENAYNNNVIFFFEHEHEIDDIKKVLLNKKIELVPIVDKNKRVVDFVTWEGVFGSDDENTKPKKRISAQVVIMAGGKGTRLDPFTKILPKPLIPIGDRPIIELILDKFKKFGIHEYYITLNHMSKIIRAYLEERNIPHTYIKFIEEPMPLGTAGSLRLLLGQFQCPVFVTNCDIIIETDYADLYDYHRKNNYDITLVASVKNYSIPYGICEIENGGSLIRIKEKPEYSFLVNTGLYVMNHEVFTLIPKDTVFNMTDLINAVKKEKGTVGVYPVSESSWIDVGEWAEYKKSIENFSNS